MSKNLEHAFFYASENGDRKYGPDSMEHWLKKFFTSGVFTGDLMVTANDNMTVTLGNGYINIDGKVRFFEDQQIFTIETAHATYDRIDSVVIERNDSDRDITAKVVKGGYASNPEALIPVRENGVDQRVVAQIYVAHGAVNITQANITDTRTDSDLCGMVATAIDNIDFNQFTKQFETYFEEFKENTMGDFLKFYEKIKDQLSEDAAGHLQLEIDDLQSEQQKSDVKIESTQDMISDAFDESKAYSAGDYAIYNNKLWKFTSAKEAGEWDESKVSQKTVDGEIASLCENLAIINRYGYAVYDDIVSKSAVWLTNVGETKNKRNVGESSISTGYNLLLAKGGTYLIICRATPSTSSITGIRGMRFYIGETSEGEEFTTPAGHESGVMYLIRTVDVADNTTCRFGVYQSSGSDVKWKNIRMDAFLIG